MGRGLLVPLLGVTLLASACPPPAAGGADQSSGLAAGPVVGGVARVAFLSDVTAWMDPAKESYPVALGLLRDMQRTLVQYPSVPAPRGSELRPDIAWSLPLVSSDRLTWSFILKPNIKFGPPISRAVVCADFRAAIERALGRAGNGGHGRDDYGVVQGAEAFEAGQAPHVSGIECLGDHALTFHLAQPAGDFAARLALPAAAPIPAAEHVARGHDADWGRFMPATGCYMWEGEDVVDFGLPVKRQRPASGYQPNRSMSLVRNPNWDASSDDLRRCYLDGIDITIGGEMTDLVRQLRLGAIDWIEDPFPPDEPAQAVRRDTRAKARPGPNVYTDTTDYLWMNPVLPPFDDVHVRRAVAWVLDRARLLRLGRAAFEPGVPAGHLLPPSMPGAAPSIFRLFSTAGWRGDLDRARAEMRLSPNDRDGDGRCDVKSCRFPMFRLTGDVGEAVTDSVIADLAGIGLAPRARSLDTGYIGAGIIGAMEQYRAAPLRMGLWATGKVYPDAFSFLEHVLGSRASSYAFEFHGGPETAAATVGCEVESGPARAACWDAIDRFAVRNALVVPWRWRMRRWALAQRVLNWQFCQFSTTTAFDAVVLRVDNQGEALP